MPVTTPRMCNCRSCRNTGHDIRGGIEFSSSAKTSLLSLSSSSVGRSNVMLLAEDNSDESNGGDTSVTSDNEELLFFQQKQPQQLVNVMLVLNENQSNINNNFVDKSSQLPNDSSYLTSDTSITRNNQIRVINDDEVDDGTNNYETHNSNNNYTLDHEFNKNRKRVWKNNTFFASLRVNTFLLVAVSTIFLLTISNGVNAGPINTTQINEITTERVSTHFL